MVWNAKWNGIEGKFWYGIWKMPEWNGMKDFKNGTEDNFSYFHTNSIRGASRAKLTQGAVFYFILVLPNKIVTLL